MDRDRGNRDRCIRTWMVIGNQSQASTTTPPPRPSKDCEKFISAYEKASDRTNDARRSYEIQQATVRNAYAALKLQYAIKPYDQSRITAARMAYDNAIANQNYAYRALKQAEAIEKKAFIAATGCI